MPIKRPRAARKSAPHDRIAIWHAETMRGVVRPGTSDLRLIMVACTIETSEAILIEVDPMSPPVEVIPAPERADDRYAHPAETESIDDYAAEVVWEIVRWKGGIRPYAIDHRGIIDWNVDGYKDWLVRS